MLVANRQNAVFHGVQIIRRVQSVVRWRCTSYFSGFLLCLEFNIEFKFVLNFKLLFLKPVLSTYLVLSLPAILNPSFLYHVCSHFWIYILRTSSFVKLAKWLVLQVLRGQKWNPRNFSKTTTDSFPAIVQVFQKYWNGEQQYFWISFGHHVILLWD